MNKYRVRIYEQGPPSVMQHEEMPAPLAAPSAGEVLLRHEAIGLNFVDTMFRDGSFNVPLPFDTGAHVVRVGQLVYVNGATGAVGSLIVKWAAALGASVIAGVGSEARELAARAAGRPIAAVDELVGHSRPPCCRLAAAWSTSATRRELPRWTISPVAGHVPSR